MAETDKKLEIIENGIKVDDVEIRTNTPKEEVLEIAKDLIETNNDDRVFLTPCEFLDKRFMVQCDFKEDMLNYIWLTPLPPEGFDADLSLPFDKLVENLKNRKDILKGLEELYGEPEVKMIETLGNITQGNIFKNGNSIINYIIIKLPDALTTIILIANKNSSINKNLFEKNENEEE